MPNKRAAGKRLIGAQIPDELLDGIAAWRAVNHGQSVTDFLKIASIEKLEKEGFPVDRATALRDGRARPVHYKISAANLRLNEK